MKYFFKKLELIQVIVNNGYICYFDNDEDSVIFDEVIQEVIGEEISKIVGTKEAVLVTKDYLREHEITLEEMKAAIGMDVKVTETMVSDRVSKVADYLDVQYENALWAIMKDNRVKVIFKEEVNEKF